MQHVTQKFAAAFQLAQLYRDIEPRLRVSLAHKGIYVANYIPRGVHGTPIPVDQGIKHFTATVQARRELLVSKDFCDTSIYPAMVDNLWFRHVHDLGHMLYQCDFDSAGERELHPQLWKWIETSPGYWMLSRNEQRWVYAVYWADTQGQTEYYDEHGKFPDDQAEFVSSYASQLIAELEKADAQA